MMTGPRTPPRKNVSERLERQLWRQHNQRSDGTVTATLTGTKSIVDRVVGWYFRNGWGLLLSASITGFACLFYIVGTYFDSEPWVQAIEIVLAVAFFLDYVLSVVAAPVAMAYIISWEGFVDLLSIFPVFGAFRRWIYSLSFIRYLRVGKAIRATRHRRTLTGKNDKLDDDIVFSVSLLVVKVVGLVFMVTAIIVGTEQASDVYLDEDGDPAGAFNDNIKWHDALYFTIVTLSTVGYGDILPVQTFSRMLMIVVIIVALTFVPFEVGQLVDAISLRPKHRGGFKYAGRTVHVILALAGAQEDDGFREDALDKTLQELFHEDHGTISESLWVVVMARSPPTPAVQVVLRKPQFRCRVLYYRGSVLDPSDMAAVGAEFADCLFLFLNPHSGLPLGKAEDRTTLAAKAVQRYLRRTPPEWTNQTSLLKHPLSLLFGGIQPLMMGRNAMNATPCRTLVVVREPQTKLQLLRFGIDQVICHDEVKMAMLACGTICPAFLPFAINTMRSKSSEGNGGTILNRMPMLNKVRIGSRELFPEGEQGMWVEDYRSGTEYEIYSVAMAVTWQSQMYGHAFDQVATTIYNKSGGKVLLLGVVHDVVVEGMQEGGDIDGSVTRDRHQSSPPSQHTYMHVTVFPAGGFIFTESCSLILLAENLAMAEECLREMASSSDQLPAHKGKWSSSLSDRESDGGSGDATALALAAAAAAGRSSSGGERTSRGQASATEVTSPQASPKCLDTNMSSLDGMSPFHIEGTKSQVESLRKEMQKAEGIRWSQTIREINNATQMLSALATLEEEDRGKGLSEEVIAKDPIAFFAKVECASHHLCSALSLYSNTVPSNLSNHLVLVGSHKRLHHYVIAARHQRPSIPLVVLTEDKDMFYSLQSKLVDSKCSDANLDITQIYPVFGSTRDRGVFEKARLSQAETVVLLSETEGTDDDAVLLGSFELEQMLSDRASPTKVLVDLRKESNIYFLGHNLVSRRGGGLESQPSRSSWSTLMCGEDSCGLPSSLTGDVYTWPLFAAGRVWTESIMDVITIQSYFSREVLAFFETLLQIRQPVMVGKDLIDPNNVLNKATIVPSPSIEMEIGRHELKSDTESKVDGWYGMGKSLETERRGQFDQLKVSSAFKGKTYGDLVRHLITLGAMALGLYRPAGHKQSRLPYTHINPNQDEPLVAWPDSSGRSMEEGDYVFLVRSKQSKLRRNHV